MKRPRCSGEDGASLVIVMAFLLLSAALCSGLLAVTGANYKATEVVREVQQRNYSSDAAIEYGIALVRSNLDRGVEGDTGCNFSLQGVNGLPTTVRCAGASGSGSGGNRFPKNAILTLSTTTPGLELDGNETLGVGGAVYSHSVIEVGSAQSELVASGNVVAESNGDCTDARVQAGQPAWKSCNAPSSPNGADPGWSSQAGSAFASSTGHVLNPLPTCSTLPGGYKLATFTAPGGYAKFTDSPGSLLSGPACSGRQGLLFAPGVYYFENVDFDTGNLDVVTGTATPNSWPAGETPNAGSACQEASPGSQFIFGGTSRLTVPNQTTRLTFCGGGVSGGPSIPLYGVAASGAGLLAQSGAGVSAGITTANKPSFYVHGTIYMPKSALELTLHNRARTFVDRGLVARSLYFIVSASSTQIDSAISIPSCESSSDCRQDRRVIFTATAAGQDQVRSEVDFDDLGGGVPGRTAAVEGWSVLR